MTVALCILALAVGFAAGTLARWSSITADWKRRISRHAGPALEAIIHAKGRLNGQIDVRDRLDIAELHIESLVESAS